MSPHRYQARIAFEALEYLRPFKGFYDVLVIGPGADALLREIRDLLGDRGTFTAIDGEASAIPEFLAGQRFDLVCLLSLSHPEALFAEAQKILRTEGVLVARAHDPLWERVGQAAGRLRTTRLSVLERAARAAGFGHVETWAYEWAPVGLLSRLGVPFASGRRFRVDRLLGRAAPGGAFLNHALLAQKR